MKKIVNMFKSLPKERLFTLKIVAGYALLSESWILVSDKILSQICNDILTMRNFQIIKGSIFVIITTYLLYLMINNIFKIKSLRNELETNEEQYKFVVNHTTDGLWDWNIETNEILLPSKWKRKLGYDEDEIPNTHEGWKSLIHPDDNNKTDIFKGYIDKKIPEFKEEYRVKKKNGEYMWTSDQGQLIWDEHGKAIRMIGMFTDITGRKNIEKALMKTVEENKKLLEEMMKNDKIKTEFFSNISHEFKTPLNVILGIVQLLSSYRNDCEMTMEYKKMDKYINVMKQNCYRLLRLINNLIDITKIDSGFLDIEFKNHNIINIIEEITLSVVEFAENKGIYITFDTEVEEKIIACDTDKIERIMLNLLSNAIKHTQLDGNIYVKIYDKEENMIISVRDTGIGIAEDKLKIIFERFRQVDSSLRRKNEGSGIGLSLVKSLVERHEGEIWIESKEGEGTEFFIKMPVRVLEKEYEEVNQDDYENHLVERVNIEFSDIYSN